MSGNQPSEPPSGETPQFPAIGQYVEVPEPGEPGYVEPTEEDLGEGDDGGTEDFEEDGDDE